MSGWLFRAGILQNSMAFGLELTSEPPVHLFFPAGGVLPPVVNGVVTNEPAVAGSNQSTQVQLATGDQMAQMLAGPLLQGQKAAMDEQKVAMSTMETSLCNVEVMIDCCLQDQGKEINQHVESVR